tara:strand:- start:1189 stop:1587 length:399 start_codon:yes stop_codon:yes gene_type:complete
MKVYCPTCGSGTEYSLKKPKFCAGCGEAFSALNKAPAKRVFKTNPQNPIATIQEEVEEEEFEMPDMDKLDVDIRTSRSFNIVSLKNLAVGEKQQDDGYVREADPTYSKTSFTEDFRRDAGSSSRDHEQTQQT